MVPLEADLVSVGSRWQYLKGHHKRKEQVLVRQIRVVTIMKLSFRLDWRRGPRGVGSCYHNDVGCAYRRRVPDIDCDHMQWNIATASPQPYWGGGHITSIHWLPPLLFTHLPFASCWLIHPEARGQEVSVEKIHRCQPTGSQSCVGEGREWISSC